MYSYKLFLFFFFFFSSRRRHTRWNCYWSSDVCYSDLVVHGGHDADEAAGEPEVRPVERVLGDEPLGRRDHAAHALYGVIAAVERDLARGERSEERRVGKECRSRWWPYH